MEIAIFLTDFHVETMILIKDSQKEQKEKNWIKFHCRSAEQCLLQNVVTITT